MRIERAVGVERNRCGSTQRMPPGRHPSTNVIHVVVAVIPSS